MTKLTVTLTFFFCVPRKATMHEDGFSLFVLRLSFNNFSCGFSQRFLLWLWVFSGGFSFNVLFIVFSNSCLKVNKTFNFNESSEMIIYFTCEEHCTVPYMFFLWNIVVGRNPNYWYGNNLKMGQIDQRTTEGVKGETSQWIEITYQHETSPVDNLY